MVKIGKKKRAIMVLTQKDIEELAYVLTEACCESYALQKNAEAVLDMEEQYKDGHINLAHIYAEIMAETLKERHENLASFCDKLSLWSERS